MKAFRHFITLLVLSLAINSFSFNSFASGGSLLDSFGMGAQDEILDVDEAFRLTTEVNNGVFIARWQITEGHYLYSDKTSITIDDVEVTTSKLQLPPGDAKDDPIFNKTLYVYHHDFEARLPFRYTGSSDKTVDFKVQYQGCSEISGICYPPQTKTISATIAPTSTANSAINPDLSTDTPTATEDILVSEQDRMSDALRSGNIWLTLLAFFAAGLLLAFTPCVFPMIPILMGIIVGQGEAQSVRKSFTLSLVYVLAMASTYTIVGILVGLSGENIQAWFQNPWIIGSFAAIFVALAMSMFGFYELQMPASIQSRLTQISNNQQGGSLLGTAIMGFLSALIVGPCVTAPLVGALIYIADTGDAALGGMALFSLSMGMGTPLLILGASAGKLLPRAGAWMEAVKAVFGVLLLALGIWLLERVAPMPVTMALWAALLIVSAVYMGALSTTSKEDSGWKKLWKGLGIILLVYGIVIFIGMAAGNRNVLQPLQGLGSGPITQGAVIESSAHLNFKQIKGVAGLQAALAEAKAQNKPVMLDFYADWCVSCKEMEALTFSDSAVQQALTGVVLLQADVTPNDEQDRELYKYFNIIGPPSIMFFDRAGSELKNFRVVGYKNADQFAAHVRSAIK
ncbi:MAG: protein-disulfide reductase DsbD [Gammaproteobacteria bacterium]|nr:protein-disulfide reductase DsbD [Gammaproteobacteria bacterium]